MVRTYRIPHLRLDRHGNGYWDDLMATVCRDYTDLTQEVVVALGGTLMARGLSMMLG